MSGASDDRTIANTLPGPGPGPGPGPMKMAAPDTAESELVADRYRIVRWLGAGGMGRVYEVLDTELGERVALKVLRAGMAAEVIERFRREVRLTRRIQHRNVARMFDIGDHGDDKFLTMELIDGISLAAAMQQQPIPWDKLQPIAVQMCAGLAAAHAAGVVHRDLKPDNVMLEAETGRIVIMDFGIARGGDDPSVTRVGTVLGTPRYMAPEQLAGNDVDARSDLFSLGLILYELASGTRPWTGDNAITIAVAQVTSEPRPLRAAVPASFAALIARCLAIDPARRPQSARELELAIASNVELPVALLASRVMPAQPLARPSETSIAVLPIACGPGDEYLADGLLDDLIDTLSVTATLRVRPAGAVRTATAPDPREVGSRLEVDQIVVASLQRIPSGLRISARLVGVADGFQIWAHRTDCTEAEILQVSESIGRGIAQALSTRATVATRPTDPRAVDLYLRARAELRRYWGRHAQAAADLLEQAADLAPTSPPILGAFAFASMQAWVMRGVEELRPIAGAALARGLALGHGEAQLASALWRFNHGDVEAGAKDLGLALVRAPMSGQAHEITARILAEVGTLTEARLHFENAAGLDLGRAISISSDVARLDALEGNFVAADVRVAALRANPDVPIMQVGALVAMRLAAWRRDHAMVIEAARVFATLAGPTAIAIVDKLERAFESQTVDMVAWDELVHRGDTAIMPKRPQVFMLQLLAETAALLQRPDLSIATLERAMHHGLIDINWLDRCPLFDPMRSTPAFRAVRDLIALRAARVLAALRPSRAHEVLGSA